MVHWAWVKVDTIIRFSVQIDLQKLYDLWFQYGNVTIGIVLFVLYVHYVSLPLRRRRLRRWSK